MKKIVSLWGIVAIAAVLGMPAIAADRNAAQESRTVPNAWPAESLSGTIVSVDPAKRIVVVKDASGVPFDMVVNRSTRIESGGHEVDLRNLNADVNRNASVWFVPEREGDVARSIQLNG